jgi:hypothetical protein
LKNKGLIGLSILSIFILCSLSYQPIIADNLTDSITKVDDAKLSDDDCDCKKINKWPFPLICFYLSLLFIWRCFLFMKLDEFKWDVLADKAVDIAKTFNCYWTKIPNLI